MHVHTTLIIVWLPAWSYVVLCIFRQGYSTTDGTGTDESPDEPNWGEGEPHSLGQDGYPAPLPDNVPLPLANTQDVDNLEATLKEPGNAVEQSLVCMFL